MNTEDLSTLDGNALVARLAVVKDRVLTDANEQAREHGATADSAFLAELADTEAVLDECAVRLLLDTGRRPSLKPFVEDVAEPAPPLGYGVMIGEIMGTITAGVKPPLVFEAERLRRLIRVLVDSHSVDRCPLCGPYERPKDGSEALRPLHLKDCPWPSLVAEAEKP